MISVIVGMFMLWQIALVMKGKMLWQNLAHILNFQGLLQAFTPFLTSALVSI